MLNFKLMREAVAAARTGATGDAALLELAALGTPPEAIQRQLSNVRGYAPSIDLDRLSSLSPGTFGRAYADFLVDNNITPLTFTPEGLERFSDNPFVVRSTVTHDMFHVLTGFDAGWSGEAGVFAFNYAQGTAPAGGRMIIWGQKLLYGLVAPTQIRRTHRNTNIGLRLGETADLLIGLPLEDYFDEPLSDVRARVGIPEPSVSGVMASGDSIVGRYILKKVLPPPNPSLAQ